MGLIDEAQGRIAECQRLAEPARVDHRRIKRCADKRISESLGKSIERIGARMERHRATDMLRDLAQIVDSVAMIGMPSASLMRLTAHRFIRR